jgi:hypothetical protein
LTYYSIELFIIFISVYIFYRLRLFAFNLKVISLLPLNYPTKPFSFITLSLNNNLLSELTGIIANIDHLLPQISMFIGQFNTLINESDVNVITDVYGNMSVDVPASMSDAKAEDISKRLGVIDRLINSHGSSLNDLFHKGLDIENKLKLDNPNYSSQLTNKILEFKRLNSSYKH